MSAKAEVTNGAVADCPVKKFSYSLFFGDGVSTRKRIVTLKAPCTVLTLSAFKLLLPPHYAGYTFFFETTDSCDGSAADKLISGDSTVIPRNKDGCIVCTLEVRQSSKQTPQPQGPSVSVSASSSIASRSDSGRSLLQMAASNTAPSQKTNAFDYVNKNPNIWTGVLRSKDKHSQQRVSPTLMFEPFGRFVDQLSGTASADVKLKDYQDARDFMIEISSEKVYSSEKEVTEAGNKFGDNRGWKFSTSFANPAGCTNDAGFEWKVGERSFLLLNREDKGMKEPDNIFQNLMYYGKYYGQSEHEETRKHTVCPAVLMCLRPGNISVSIVAMDEFGPVLQNVFQSTLVWNAEDNILWHNIARFIRALENLTESLKQLYSGARNTWYKNPCGRGHFPYFGNELCANEKSVTKPRYSLCYLSQVPRKRVFRAVVDLESVSTAVMVKFTDRYFPQMHMFLAAEGFAPAVLEYVKLPGFWHVIVMEQVVGTIPFANLSESRRVAVKQELLQILEMLKGKKWVHGDLRIDHNILCRLEGKVQVIDFDWAGVEGKTRYPASVDTKWFAPDVEGLAPIMSEQDFELIDNLRV